MTAHEVRFALESRLLSLAHDGRVPQIVGVHSISIEGDTVFAGFDLLDPDEVLFFEFTKLPELVSRDEVRDFTLWLAFSGDDETRH